MAKNKLGISDTFNLSPKVAVKKSEIDIERTEKVVKEIHSSKKEIKRVPLEMDMDLYTQMMIKRIVGKQKVKGYLIGLIKKDLGIE
ncbi:hypothetical protein FEM33_15015 [Dyadobacter flavalbus]|uniref:Uncharacterized protein n=1 Tax=Dyadobacter flavalbus TaxID=2579942 RepID=A0A5M8QRW3_9BACT|nr:hypothetical protein [Dyadobacter flavalbus]KAA6438945.1 hypothetical protein FEM33_15015 [Dyadobacter flavalbus]